MTRRGVEEEFYYHHQTCSGSDKGSEKKEYSIYFGSGKKTDLPIYGVEQNMEERKFL